MSAEVDMQAGAAPGGLWRRTPKWQILGAMLLVAYGYVWHNPRTNELSRLNLVYAVVFHGKLDVDEFKDNTIDMAFHKGHYYSDKAPGLSFAAAPVMWALKPVWLSVKPTLLMRNFLTVYLVRFLALSLPSAVFGVLLYFLLLRAGAGERYGLALALAYGLGTLVLPYSALFYGHQLGTALGFGAFMLLIMKREATQATGTCMLAGLLAGYAVVVEYPMAAVAVILGVYVLATRRDVMSVAALVLGGLIGIAPLLLYNAACFDSPFALGYSFEKTEHFQRHLSEGLFGITTPQWRRFYDGTISLHRGIFTLSPFLCLFPFGWWRMVRNRHWRAEALVVIAVLVVFVAFTSSLYEESYAPGERHLIPVLPFLILPLAFCPARVRPWVVGLGVLSMFEWTIINLINPRVGESIDLPFLKTFLPRFVAGEFLDYNWGAVLGLKGKASTVPLWAAQAGLAALLFSGRPASRFAEQKDAGTGTSSEADPRAKIQ